MPKTIMNSAASAPPVPKAKKAPAFQPASGAAAVAGPPIAKRAVPAGKKPAAKIVAAVGKKGRGVAVVRGPLKSARALRIEASPAEGITGSRIRALALQRSLNGMSKLAIGALRTLLGGAVEHVLAAAIEYTLHGRRKTVSGDDVLRAYTTCNTTAHKIYTPLLPDKKEDSRAHQKKAMQAAVTHRRAKHAAAADEADFEA